MHPIGRLISRYLLTTIVPYFFLSWLLLSMIMFVQQASRFSDIFFNLSIPAELAWQLTLALVPNVVSFTCPAAVLVGTVIGLSKMQGDSELVAIRAAGVGNWQIAAPIMLLGILLSIFAFVVNEKGVPLATRLVKRIALETAIKKLESPVEPGVINTELAGFAIYVGGGNVETGHWQNIFVQVKDTSRERLRLITARRGRIDTSEQESELVLEDATGWSIPTQRTAGSEAVFENLGELRLAIRTKRDDLIDELNRSGLRPDVLGLDDRDTEAALSEKERQERNILVYRRLLLSGTPLLFCVLGTFIVLRFSRGGRGFGLAVSLGVLVVFYILTFTGEQMVRTGVLPIFAGVLVPLVGCAGAVWWFGHKRGGVLWDILSRPIRAAIQRLTIVKGRLGAGDLFIDLTTGLRDFDLLRNLVKNFVLALAFLLALFLIFTTLDLWRRAAVIDGGWWYLLKYLIFLLPYLFAQLVPTAAMVTVMATYVIKSRQNELVTWAAAGQSIYRLLVPAFALMLLIGGAAYIVQETVLPRANRIQDEARQYIVTGGKLPSDVHERWGKGNGRLYAYTAASDNEQREGGSDRPAVANLHVFEFDEAGRDLRSVIFSDTAIWRVGRVVANNVQRFSLDQGKIVTSVIPTFDISEAHDPFSSSSRKPAHMGSAELRQRRATAESDLGRRAVDVPLQRSYSTLFLPLVMALVTAPLSVTLVGRGGGGGLVGAVGLWLLFIGTGAVFDQFGLNGQLDPATAVWAPIFIFAFLGIFLVSRVKT